MLAQDFMLRALLAGLGVAVAAAPLGCFVVWRRMAYFGDATGHAAVLGVALALAAGLPVAIGVLIVAVAMALTVSRLSGRSHSIDTLLGVMSHGALAAGLVAVVFIGGVRVDLEAYLFGDILAVTRGDIAVIWAGALLVTGLMAWRWRAMLATALNEDLAHAAGLNPRMENRLLALALAAVVAVAIKVVGALMITAMLIIPAAAARPLVVTPERMVLAAGLAGALAVTGGLEGALIFDTPAGPSIVCAAVLLFLASRLAAALRLRKGARATDP